MQATVTANVLADRLGALVGHRLLAIRVYQQRPRRHEYLLTEKGADLIPALLALMQWGDPLGVERRRRPSSGGTRGLRPRRARVSAPESVLVLLGGA